MDLQALGFVVLVSLIIATIGAVYIDIYLSMLYQYSPVAFWLMTPPFAVVYILLWVSYLKAVCTQSGHPNKSINRNFTTEQIEDYIKRTEAIKIANKQRRKKRSRLSMDPEQTRQMKEMTYCQKCDVVRLPRVHHCKLCDRCIERMDHHCPWVGNCVGRGNHKYFILFLLYASIGLAVVWISVGLDFLQGWPLMSKSTVSIATTLLGMAALAALMLFLAIFVLFVTQMMMASNNYTTIESFIPGVEDKSPFDTGNWNENMRQIFGDSMWLIPVSPKLPQYQPERISFRESENINRSPEQYNKAIASQR